MELFKLSKERSHQETTVRQYLIDSDSRSNRSSNLQLPTLKKIDTSPGRKSKLKTIKKEQPEVDSPLSDTYSQKSNKPTEPQQFKTGESQNPSYIYNNYEITDLTFSLINAQINMKLLAILFTIQIVIRYISVICLVYITADTHSENWQWVFCLAFSSILYFLCIVKISLKPPETKSEVILKESFNSLEENQAVQYFQVISPKKLIKCMLRGMIPPQFSFIYIKNMKERRIQIYTMINFMYSSIEAVIYYPFFIIYTEVIYQERHIGISNIIYHISLSFIVLSETIFISLSIYLIIFGCKKRGLWKKADRAQE